MTPYQRQIILSITGYVATRGGDPYDVCEEAGIKLDTLLDPSCQPTATYEQINHLWLAAADSCDDEFFGLHFGESLQLSALGAVGDIIKSSKTVGEAISIAASAVPLITDAFMMEVSDLNDRFCVSLKQTGASSASESVTRHIADFLMVFTIHELDGLILKRVEPSSAEYPVDGTRLSEVARVLRCSKITKGITHALYFDKGYLQLPILTANYDLQQFLLHKIKEHSAPTFTQDAISVRVREFLMKNSYLGLPSLENVASNFNMTPRSLQRRLQEESTNFQELADLVRKSLAIHYLHSGKYQIKEISTMLGYNELSAFSRAFKRWTGKPPISYTNR